MSQSLEARFLFSDEMARSGARSYLRKQSAQLVFSLLAAVPMLLFAALSGITPFLGGLFLGYFLALSLLLVFSAMAVRRFVAAAQSLPDREFVITVSKGALTCRTWTGTQTVLWPAVSAVVFSKGYATLLVGKVQPSATPIPESAMSADFREALISNVKGNGGRLVV